MLKNVIPSCSQYNQQCFINVCFAQILKWFIFVIKIKVVLLVIFSYQCDEYFTHSNFAFALKRASSVYTSIVL